MHVCILNWVIFVLCVFIKYYVAVVVVVATVLGDESASSIMRNCCSGSPFSSIMRNCRSGSRVPPRCGGSCDKSMRFGSLALVLYLSHIWTLSAVA